MAAGQASYASAEGQDSACLVVVEVHADVPLSAAFDRRDHLPRDLGTW